MSKAMRGPVLAVLGAIIAGVGYVMAHAGGTRHYDDLTIALMAGGVVVDIAGLVLTAIHTLND